MAPKRLKLSRSTAVQLGAAGLLGAASVAAGGVAAPLIMALIGKTGPTSVDNFLQSLLANVLSGVFGDTVTESVADADKARRNQQNHDLQRAMTLAIARCLRRAAAALPAGDTPPAYLTAIADTIEANPLQLMITPLDETEITAILSGSVTAIRTREVLTAEQWRELLELAAIDTQPSLSLTPRIDVQTAVEFCQQHFADELIQTLKGLGADSDPAWFALVLRFLSEIHGGVNETNSNVKQLVAANDAFKEVFAAHSKSMLQAIDELKAARQERGFATADAVALDDIRRTMTAIRDTPPRRFVLDVNALPLRRAPALREWPLDPYPLLGPYTREETFAGRERELDECELTVTRRSKLILCLHAPSGAGKSSLLEAGLLPRLLRLDYATCIERYPGEPGLAHRLVEQLFDLPPEATIADEDPWTFRRLMVRAHELTRRPPVLMLDQIDGFLRDEATREAALERLGPLMAATAKRESSLGGYPCRWILCCRQDFLGDIRAWLRDVLRESRRTARFETAKLPSDLSGSDRCMDYALPLMGEAPSGQSAAGVATSVFLDAIRQPLTLRDDQRRIPRYRIRFEGDGDQRLAEAFARARERRRHEALVPELQVVLSHLLASASTQGNDRVMQVPQDVDAFIADALSRHLVRALDRAFPLERDIAAMEQGRARALLVLHDLAEERKLRNKGLPESALKSALGDGAEEVLGRLSDSDTRLIVRESRSIDGVDSYALAHDCLVEVVTRAVEVNGTLGDFKFDRRVVELRRFVGMRADLYGRANDQAALELDDEQYDLIERHQQALVTDDSRKKWWNECRLLRTDLPYAIGWRGIPALRVNAVKRVLSQHSDRRFRDEAWWLPRDPHLGFVEVPGGQFQMGSADSDSESWSEEQRRHQVDVGSFFIARWPVTVAQFRAFVEDTADNQGFSMHEALIANGSSEPMTMVSWHDAQAYCRWLTKKLVTWKDTPASLAERLRAKDRRWRVALATESEWEKAARGVDGRIYSWGAGSVTPDKANYRDSGVGGTSPVGCFPDGAGPGGVQEMAGNVWEWTRSLWGTNPANPDFAYPYRADDGREHENASDDELRVVRGGSFLNARVHLRAACRGRCEPRKRAFDVGFRVVVSPLSMS